MIATLATLLAWLTLLVGGTRPMTSAPDDADAIRARRAAFNTAIAHHDTLAIGEFFDADYHIVTSRGEQTHGAEANRHTWTQIFASQPGVSYVRTPTHVRVFAPWGMAEETGAWVGTWRASDGPVEMRGTYAAKWRKRADRWLLTVEVFTPSSCRGGSACKPLT